jgi:hypothetical protein
MKFKKESTKTISLESYVTLRAEWSPMLRNTIWMGYNARGHRVVDGRMEWQYFADEIEAKKWSEAIHIDKN